MRAKFNPDNFIGKKFGKLEVVSYAELRKYRHFFNCECKCGGECVVRSDSLITGNTQTCGCMRGGSRKQNRDGLTAIYPSEYASFHHMNSRCYNPKHIKYHLYGGRTDGNPVQIQPNWRFENPDGFKNFLKDVGPKPKPKKEYTIERRNPWGHYIKMNCYWIHNTQQAKNRRANSEFSGVADLTEYIV